MTSENIIAWLLILSPLIVGASICFSKSEPAVGKVDRLDAWLIAKYDAAREKEGGFNRFVARPLLWLLTRVLDWTEAMPDAYLRSGVRVTAYGYITGLTVYLVAVVTVAALMIFVAFWLLGQFLESGSGGTTYMRRVADPDQSKVPWSNIPVGFALAPFHIRGDCKANDAPSSALPTHGQRARLQVALSSLEPNDDSLAEQRDGLRYAGQL